MEMDLIVGVHWENIKKKSEAFRWHSGLPTLFHCEHTHSALQLVLSGDFCQLPPVPSKDSQGAPIPSTFAFDAQSWDRCVGRPICLKKVFRQKEQGLSP